MAAELAPSIGARRRSSALFGWFGAATLITAVLSDTARRFSPGQSIAISMAPLIVASIGALLAFGRRPRFPRSARIAVTSLIVLCLFSTLIARLNGLPGRQVLAGWIAEAGALPGLFLGFALCFERRGWRLFRKVLIALLLASIGIAVLQQLGLFQTQVFEMIEGAHVERGLVGGGTFRYTSGPFRTANVFSLFLAVTGLVVVVNEGEQLDRGRKMLGFAKYVLIALLVVTSLMAARRSGLIMLLGSLVPFLFVAGGRLKFAAVAMVGAGLIYFAGFGADAPLESDLTEKVQFATTEFNVGGRLGQAFTIKERDWHLTSAAGDGIGSHGPATQAGGAGAFRHEQYLVERHPVLHVGWFKDFVSFGYFGFVAHFVWFLFLILAVFKSQRLATARNNPARFSGLGFLGVAVINYYFVATSWLQSVTGGLLFGLAIGVFLGRMRIGEREPGRRDGEAAAKPGAPSS